MEYPRQRSIRGVSQKAGPRCGAPCAIERVFLKQYAERIGILILLFALEEDTNEKQDDLLAASLLAVADPGMRHDRSPLRPRV